MSHPVLTLESPEDVYVRVRRAARGMNQPLETALVYIVRAATPSRERVRADDREIVKERRPEPIHFGVPDPVASPPSRTSL
jgi:hypothetical protein